MCYACDYCYQPLPAGKLRMVPDADLGGATQMCCHDCFHPGCDDDDCAWLSHQTADEWAEERQAQAEAAADDKAHARRFNIMEWVMFG